MNLANFNSNVKTELPTVNVSPNTITDFKNINIASTLPNNSSYDLSKQPNLTKLFYGLIGTSMAQRYESLDSLIDNFKDNKNNILHIELVGKARAYETSSLPENQISYLNDYVFSYDSESPQFHLWIPNSTDISIKKNMRIDDFFGEDINFTESMDKIQKNIVNLHSWLKLDYSEKEKFEMTDFNISTQSLLKIKEVSFPFKFKSRMVWQTAVLGFSVKSNVLENKRLTEEYQIKLNVQKYVQNNNL